jgi:hypothetical protein
MSILSADKLAGEPSNAERNQYQLRPGQDAVDGYTLSTSDQYRRPAITAPQE